MSKIEANFNNYAKPDAVERNLIDQIKIFLKKNNLSIKIVKLQITKDEHLEF